MDPDLSLPGGAAKQHRAYAIPLGICKDARSAGRGRRKRRIRDNPDFHAIVTAYRRRTGIGTVVNTSFNMHEEPIVCTIDDALRAVRAAGLPFLAAGDFLVETRGEESAG